MKFRPDLLSPPAALVIEDVSVVYRRQLRQAKERQAMRDAQHEAWIDNLFYGQLYVSLYDELISMEDGEISDGT